MSLECTHCVNRCSVKRTAIKPMQYKKRGISLYLVNDKIDLLILRATLNPLENDVWKNFKKCDFNHSNVQQSFSTKRTSLKRRKIKFFSTLYLFSKHEF